MTEDLYDVEEIKKIFKKQKEELKKSIPTAYTTHALLHGRKNDERNCSFCLLATLYYNLTDEIMIERIGRRLR